MLSSGAVGFGTCAAIHARHSFQLRCCGCGKTRWQASIHTCLNGNLVMNHERGGSRDRRGTGKKPAGDTDKVKARCPEMHRAQS